jgi:leucyl/phenylalanyl-tRNA--protein transferase
MLDAYAHGIFPWPGLRGGRWVTGWFSPDPRAILPLDGLHIPSRLKRKLRQGRFLFSWNEHFEEVLRGCATTGADRRMGTWLSPSLQRAITTLHHTGNAHAIAVHDVKNPQAICGGVYGIAVGGLFSAESMFHTVSDASKGAIVAMVHRLNSLGYTLLDIQQASSHMTGMGARNISRCEYLERVAGAVEITPQPFGKQPDPIPLSQFPA